MRWTKIPSPIRFHSRPRRDLRLRADSGRVKSCWNDLTPFFLVEITGAESDPGENERRRGRKRHWIKRRRWKIDNSIFIRPRRASHVATAPRRAESFGESFHSFRQIRIGNWNAVAAPDYIRSQLCQVLYRRASRFPIAREGRRRARQSLFSSN